MAILEQGMVFDGDTPCLPGPQPPLGYIYIAEIDTRIMDIKVGCSVNPRRMKKSRHLTRIWVSPPHLTYIANELKLMRAVARLKNCGFDDAIAAAQDFNYSTDPVSHLVFELRK
jgi:hypothetical protein